MTKNTIANSYFLWLYKKVEGKKSYRKLSRYIHDVWTFTWVHPLDVNRQTDGYDLRPTFFYETGKVVTVAQIDRYIPHNVSVFEVLVALCERMEYNLDDMVSGPRTHIWYSELLENLGLGEFSDDVFTTNDNVEKDIDYAIQVLLDRTYDSDGDGSLFPIEKPSRDMRKVEIWYQMMAYIHERY